MARVLIQLEDGDDGDLYVRATACATAPEQTEADVLAAFSARLAQRVLRAFEQAFGGFERLGEPACPGGLDVLLFDRCPDGCDCTARCGDDPRLTRDRWGRKTLPEAPQ